MELLTIAEIARRLDIPESTARYYRDRFSAYVPTVGQGRHKRYLPEALPVLRLVAEYMQANTPAEEIEAALSARFPLTIAVDPQDRNSATAHPQPTATAQQPPES